SQTAYIKGYTANLHLAYSGGSARIHTEFIGFCQSTGFTPYTMGTSYFPAWPARAEPGDGSVRNSRRECSSMEISHVQLAGCESEVVRIKKTLSIIVFYS